MLCMADFGLRSLDARPKPFSSFFAPTSLSLLDSSQVIRFGHVLNFLCISLSTALHAQSALSLSFLEGLG